MTIEAKDQKLKMEYVIKSESKLKFNFFEIWEYRELLFFFTWRDIKIKYKQTTLGFLWAILQPVVMMVIFTFFFGSVLKVPSDGIPYPIFAFSGLIIWNVFSNSVSAAGTSMVANSNIIKKIYFPRLIIPLSAILVSVFDFLITFLLFILLIFFFDFDVLFLRFSFCYLLSVAITVTCSLGIGSLLSALNVKYRDFRYIIPFLLQILLFITPVIYPTSLLSNKLIKFFIQLNPITGAVNLSRYAINSNSIDWNAIVVSIISSLIFLVIGIFYFRKTEAYFADVA